MKRSYGFKDILNDYCEMLASFGNTSEEDIKKEVIEYAEKRCGKSIDELDKESRKRTKISKEMQKQLEAWENEF